MDCVIENKKMYLFITFRLVLFFFGCDPHIFEILTQKMQEECLYGVKGWKIKTFIHYIKCLSM